MLAPFPWWRENEGRFAFAHSILIRDEVSTRIDAGCGLKRLERIREEYRPDLVLNPHTHPDQGTGNWLFEAAPLLVPAEASGISGQLVKMSERFTEPGELAKEWRSYVQEATGFQEIQPTHAHEDGRRFRLGTVELAAIHSPGHAGDRYGFVEPRLEVLFSFDIDLAAFRPWYRCRESDIELSEASARRVQVLRPRIVLSSHLGIISDTVDERFEAYLNIIPRREQEILTLLSQEHRLEEIVDQAHIYGSLPYAPELLRYWERQMLQKHLERLVERGLVRERDGAYVRV